MDTSETEVPDWGDHPIANLLESHGNATVELYGDATVKALDEHPTGESATTLLKTIKPLATVDLSEVSEPDTSSSEDGSGDQQFDKPQPNPRLPDAETAKALELTEQVCWSNTTIICLERANGA